MLKTTFPQITTRLLFIAIVAYANVSVAAVEREKSLSLYEDGLSYFKLEKFTESVIQLRNALQQDAENLPARILLGRVLLRQDQVAAAVTEFETALSLGGDENLILPPLGLAYLESLQPEKVITNIVPDGREPEIEAELLLLHGRAHDMLGHAKPAEEAYLKASTLLPADPRPQLAMAKIAISKRQNQKAMTLIEQAQGLAPNDFDVLIFKAIWLRDIKNFQPALAAFDDAIKIRPTSGRALTARAALWLDVGQVENAKKDLTQVFELEVETMESVYLQTLIYFREGEHDEAQKLLRKSADTIRGITDEARTQLPHTTLMMGIVAYFDENFSESIEHFQKFLARTDSHAGAKRYLAAAYLALEDWDALIKLYKPSPGVQVPSDPMALSMLAEAYRAKKNYKLAEKYYEIAMQLAPQSAGMGIRLAMSRLEAGKSEQALKDLTWLTEKFPDLVQAKIQLTNLYIKIGNLTLARDYVSQLVNQHAENGAVRLLAGSVYTVVGDYDLAREHTQMAQILLPDATLPKLNLARIARLQNDLTTAELTYRGILETDPKDVTAALELVQVLAAQGEMQEAKDRIATLVNSNPEFFEAHQLSLNLKRSDFKKNEELQEAAYALMQQFPKEPKAELLAGQVSMQIGDRDEAKRLFRSAVENADFDTELLVANARSQIALPDMNGALWSLTKATQASPENVEASMLLSTVLIDTGNTKRAQEIISQFLDSRPEDPKVLATQGHWLMATGEAEEGLAIFQRVFEMTRERESMNTLFRAYQAAGRHQEGIALLSQWLKENPKDFENHHKLAQAFIVSRQYFEAQRIYENLRQSGTEDVILLNNLAAIYQRLGDPRALATAKQAYKNAPEISSVLDTYGWILTENGKVKEGLALLREAFARFSTGPEIRYHIGLALAKLGKEKEAVEELQASLDSGQGFTDLQNAQKLLAKLKK